MTNPGPVSRCRRSLCVLLATSAACLLASQAEAGTWQAMGVDDCPGHDVAGSRGPAPEAGKCDASFAGYTAVCWTTGCTYKNIPAAACRGGASPGQMYTCVASGPQPVSSGWQSVGVGDCPGRDVAGTAGPNPDPSRCNASFLGNTAVCWANGCTYKTVATPLCTGGMSPGQMYTCATSAGPLASPPSSPPFSPPVAAPPAPVPMVAAPTLGQVTAAPTAIGGWQPAGVGDCSGHDLGGSNGPMPDPAKCDTRFAGYTAVCWANGCTYKDVPTGTCTGGAHPGQLYNCAAGAPPPPPAQAIPTPPPGKGWGKRYYVVNYAGEKENPHEFLVNWGACKVFEISESSERGNEDISVQHCKPGKRLVVKTQFSANGHWILYDWVVLENGGVLAGSYHEPASSGPSVGRRGH
jgi:hypothetical protein